jgi:hypothetical protein
MEDELLNHSRSAGGRRGRYREENIGDGGQDFRVIVGFTAEEDACRGERLEGGVVGEVNMVDELDVYPVREKIIRLCMR